MTHAAARHRELDRRAALAMGEQPGHALLRSRNRLKDMRSMSDRKPRVLLLEVEIRTSERTGRHWYSAWLGKARLIGFEAEEPNDRGHRVIRFYVEEPAGTPAARQRPPRSDAGSASAEVPTSAAGRPGISYRAPQPESARTRQERVAGEILRERGDEEVLNDSLPF
ncbi:MAG: hypothetical protein AB7O95_03280 [Geminicoccaceae bacterium]